MAPNINNPGGVKNDDDEIRDAVVTDATKFPGGNIDLAVSEAGAPVQFVGSFDVTKASFFSSFDVSSQVSGPHGVTFNPSGSDMYVVGAGNNTVFQYSLSAAFDVTTANVVGSFNGSSQATFSEGLAFSSSGSSLYVVGATTSDVFQYSLSTAFDVTTASFDSSFDVSAQEGDPLGVTFDDDGSSLYVVGSNSSDVHQYSLSTAFDVTTASFDSSFDVSSQDSLPRSVTFSADGTSMYIIGGSNDTVVQYRLSTAFDATTASFESSFSVTSQATNPHSVAFSSRGTSMVVGDDSSTTVFQYLVGKIGPSPL
jgi:sugar lactone lactonase YvrE